MDFTSIVVGAVIGGAGVYFLPKLIEMPPASAGGSGYRREVKGLPAGGLKAEISIPYARLAAVFGDADKSSGDMDTYNTWVFQGPGGPFSIYDHNDDGSKRRSYKWHIGGKGNVEGFVAWLKASLEAGHT